MKRLERPSSPFDSVFLEKGGPGSGNRGHAGRPGKRGGSAPNGGAAVAEPKTEQFVPFQNIEEAKKYFEEKFQTVLLVDPDVDGKIAVDIANQSANAFNVLKEKVDKLPGVLWLSNKNFDKAHLVGAVGMYQRSFDGIEINPASSYFRGRAGEFVQAQFDSGFWSSNDPNHVFYHEVGHREHNAKDPEKFKEFLRKDGNTDNIDIAEINALSGKVSKYALHYKTEFVAEVFAGHVAGRKFDPIVHEYYKRWGGPKLKGLD